MTNTGTVSGRRRFLKTGGAIAVAGVAAGCLGGGGGDGGDGGDGSGDGGGDGSSGDGGDGQSSDSMSLMERAQQEGQVRMATSITGINDFYAQFEEDTGVKFDRYRSDAKKVATRILQEYTANQLSFDIQQAGDPQPAIDLAGAGVYADVPEPIAEQWPERLQLDGTLIIDWYGLKLTLLYNKDLVDNPPTSVEEMANDWAGKYTVDVRDEFIYVAMLKRFGEERAKELVQMLGKGAVWKESHFTAIKNVAAGEVPMGLSYNKFKYYEEMGGVISEQKLEGLPSVVRSISSSILNGAKNPDAAHLYMKYTQENGVDFLKSTGRPDAYLSPDKVIGNDEYFRWDPATLKDIDLEKMVERWEQYTGLTG